MIKSVAVLGAGTMGAQIAAHFANAAVPALLLDLSRKVAADGLERARGLRPDPFFTRDAHPLISTGGFDEDLARVVECDWIIEAIVEHLDAKQELLARVEPYCRPDAIISSNTSGIPIASLARGRGDDFRRHWLGTHFFNPPRYLPLLEVIPTPETDPAVVSTVCRFADRRLGKGVVVARDTPNFIANHIGLYGMVRILDALASGRYSIEEIDAMTGPALGRPKSATFRTADIAGLDVLAHVAQNLSERLDNEADRRAFALPPLIDEMVRRGWIGEKAGQGFYRREKGPGAEDRILALDPATLEYRRKRTVRLPSLDAARVIDDPRERIRTLFLGHDRVGEFLRETLGPTLLYTARVTLEIAHSIDDVDRVMRWGYGWEIGPFEIWDAIGVRDVLAATALTSAGPSTPASTGRPVEQTTVVQVPALVREVLDAGRNTFRDHPLPPAAPDLQLLRSAKERRGVLTRTTAASLIDLGDGVLGLEFHSKMNTIGGDTVQMLFAAVSEASRNFSALVVGSEAAHFSAGANLMLLLLEAQEGNWDEIDLMVRTFQRAVTGLREAGVPVVVAPAGMALGGGCEIVLHADRVQAAGEAYIGLVEAGVGLIPAGGGTKEMLVRALRGMPSPSADPLPFVQRVFETIGFAKVSASGPDAIQLGYLRTSDAITMNRERLIFDAKLRALEMARDGYQPPIAPAAIPVGGENLLAALKLGVHLAWRAGRISDHDALVGRTLASILAGGSLPHATLVNEQYLLDLEREAFLRLCGEPKTQERIAYTLKTGKTLRN